MRKKITGWGLLVLIVILGYSVAKNTSRVVGIDKDIEAEKAKIAKLKADNDELTRQIAEAQSADFIEKEVRNELGLAKNGEAIVVLPDDLVLRSLAPKVDATPDTLPDPTWKRWLKLFL